MTVFLPNIEFEKWQRYYFESKYRYYIVILQQDIFHQWSIIKCYGGKNNKLGNLIIQSCNSYDAAINEIEEIKKIRKAHKYILKRLNASKLDIKF